MIADDQLKAKRFLTCQEVIKGQLVKVVYYQDTDE